MSKDLKTINYKEKVEKASNIIIRNKIGNILVKKNDDIVGIVGTQY
jgi:predicted transcriptional regulator